MLFKQVLVALDSTPQSALVLDWILQFKLTSETKFVLCHVIPLIESNLEQTELASTDAVENHFRAIEEQLQSYQALLPNPSVLEIMTGDPSEEIIRLASIYAADLIVLGSRGLTGVNRILKGSVSSQVVSEAPCTVLVVKLA